MRRARLALAGAIWAVLLLVVATALLTDTERRQGCVPTKGGVVCRARGGLPESKRLNSATYVDHRLSRAILAVTRYGSQVQCYSDADWKQASARWTKEYPRLGRIGSWRALVHPVGFVHLSPEVCAELRRLRTLTTPAWQDERPDALAYALGTLAHEAVHVTGNRNEVEAMCRGMQWMPRFAAELGLSRGEGRYLATLFWLHWYPWYGPDYRSPECRDGGRLDVRPASGVWP
jgi:hypothetical protein